LRLRHSRLRAVRRVALSALAVIGGGLGVYALLAIAFHMLLEPTLGQGYATYKPPASAVVAAQTPVGAQAPVTPQAPAAGQAPVVVEASAPALPAVEPQPRPAFAVAAVAPDAAANAGAAEPKSEAKSEPKPAATRARHYRSRHYWNAWNAWGFGGSFGRRRWF